MILGRRAALAGLMGLAMTARARADSESLATNRLAGKSLAVIGAGMAGLAAAGRLVRAGANVTIYEARRRIGGRILTARLWPDLPCDLGASWIHGTKGNPLVQMAQDAGAEMVVTRYDSAMAFRNGAAAEEAAVDIWDLAEAARTAAWKAPRDISLRQALLASPQAGPLGEEALRALAHRGIEQEYGGDWGQLSARHFDAGRSFGGADVLFPHGYDALVRAAAQGLPIRLGAKVTKITARARAQAGAGAVHIGFDGGQSISADAAIVTLPLGVLQSGAVVFDPPLAPARQAAIATLGMGLLNKVFLRFDTLPPTPPVDWLEKLDAPETLFPEWVNLAHVLGAPALLGFNAAAMADEVETWTDADTAAAASDAMRAMFGSAFPAPIAAQITRWRGDEFALGSYSYHRLGAGEGARAALFGADWDGRLAFAGEAASADHPSTVHGAWASGQAAANWLL